MAGQTSAATCYIMHKEYVHMFRTNCYFMLAYNVNMPNQMFHFRKIKKPKQSSAPPPSQQTGFWSRVCCVIDCRRLSSLPRAGCAGKAHTMLRVPSSCMTVECGSLWIIEPASKPQRPQSFDILFFFSSNYHSVWTNFDYSKVSCWYYSRSEKRSTVSIEEKF